MTTKKTTFSSLALNKLVDESIAEADQFNAELKDINTGQIFFENNEDNYDDYLEKSDKNWSEVDSVINKEDGESVSFNYVYKKICDLIDSGQATLQMLQAVDLDVADPQLLTASATLINTIKGCISEFTKIHQQWVRFNQTLKLERVRFEHRKELIKYRNNLNSGTNAQAQSLTDLVEVKTTDLVEFLQWKKEKEAIEKEKENKI